MLAPVPTCLALLAVISQQEMLLQAAPAPAPAPFPAIENAAFTSQDLLAEESAAVAWQQELAPALSHVQHKRHRRHHEDSSRSHGHHHHKRHRSRHFPAPSCHHGSHERFGPDYHHHGHSQRFDPYPNVFGPFPGFGPPGHDDEHRPFKAELEPFKENNGESLPGPRQTRTSSVAPPTSTTAASSSTSTTSTTPAPPSAAAQKTTPWPLTYALARSLLYIQIYRIPRPKLLILDSYGWH